MDNQKLFDLIERTSDTSNALRLPSTNELVEWIKASGIAKELYRDKGVEADIDCLRNSVYSTASERRDMVSSVLRAIVTYVCEVQGLDLVYRFADRPYTLHVGIVQRQTHNGFENVYGIRDSNNSADPVWEYIPVQSKYSLMQAMAWRYRAPLRASIHGYHDHSLIGAPQQSPTVG